MDLLRIINLKLKYPLFPRNFHGFEKYKDDLSYMNVLLHETLLHENNPVSRDFLVLSIKLVDSGIQATDELLLELRGSNPNYHSIFTFAHLFRISACSTFFQNVMDRARHTVPLAC